MSQAALCQAMVSTLQSVLGLDDSVVGLALDGVPHPNCGEEFIAVWSGSWQPIPCEGLGESFGANVTVTRRYGYVPGDRASTEVWAKVGGGLDERLRQIVIALHLDKNADAVRNAANALIGVGANGFVTPPRFQDGGRPEPKSYDWFTAEPPDEQAVYFPAGVAQTLRFGGAERYQTIESMS